MDSAPASRAFSTSSFTTEAGRSTTSPAAMRSATSLGRTAISGRAAARGSAALIRVPRAAAAATRAAGR
ncbi:MAG: hypothetical protein ACKORK_01640, partial [Gemmatimonadota bacterium]